MKKIWNLLFVVALLALVACNGKKEYVISGSFDLPTTVQMGDTVIERGPLDGVQVYMLDIEGQPIDSTVIVNEAFEFAGTVDADEPFFAYIVCDWGAGMVVVEPGNIDVCLTDGGIAATGTSLNDDITDLEAALQNAQEEFYAHLYALYNSGDSVSQSQMMSVYMQEQQTLIAIIDSVYQSNKENLVGVYAVNLMVGQANSKEVLDEMLSEYSDYVKNSALIQSYYKYLESVGNAQSGMGEEDFDYPEIAE